MACMWLGTDLGLRVEGLVSSVLGFADREFDAAGDDGQDNPKTIDTKPSTLNPQSQTSTLNLKPLNPKSETRNPHTCLSAVRFVLLCNTLQQCS